MNIAIIGSGHIGGSLAQGWAKIGHRIFAGVRNPEIFSPSLTANHANLTVHSIKEAVQSADLIAVCVPAKAVVEVAQQIGPIKDKYIIETTNGPLGTAAYPHAVAALKAITGSADVIKCFNTTGYETVADPLYIGTKADTFMAGSSQAAKETVRLLARELGFGECYDLGDDTKIELLDQLTAVWGALAFTTGLGRNIALKVMRR